MLDIFNKSKVRELGREALYLQIFCDEKDNYIKELEAANEHLRREVKEKDGIIDSLVYVQ